MALKRLIVGGIAFVALMYAAACNQTTSNNVRDDKPAVTSTNKGSNTTIDNHFTPVPIGQNGNGNGNGNGGDDPVEEAISLYKTRGEPIDCEKQPNEYISVMESVLNKAKEKPMDKLNQQQRDMLSEAFDDLGLAYRKDGKGRDDLSEKTLLMALQYNKDNAIALRNLGIHRFLLGKYKESLECYERVLEIEPNNTMAKIYKRKCLDKLNN